MFAEYYVSLAAGSAREMVVLWFHFQVLVEYLFPQLQLNDPRDASTQEVQVLKKWLAYDLNRRWADVPSFFARYIN
jgi:hypothetical protein